MRWIFKAISVLALAALTLSGTAVPAHAKQERPEYTVVSTEGDVEIRDYETMVLAQFTMRGSYRQSVSQGYMKLEQYFLGKNSVPEPIAMTVPTMVRDDLAGGWATMFYMGKRYRADTAPRPHDSRIRVIEFPPRRIAAIVFPGKLNDDVMREQVEKLEEWLAAHGIAHAADFTLAGYDAPWVPASRRHNEVLVTLK
ncbi:MAG TPA: heme-binding protein [Thermohalobaculum sp.]|nr:heme-binding protein [Thermohalobaculum sp.]